MVVPQRKTEHFKLLIESRIAEQENVLETAQRETRGDAARYADPADQAASEYERQSLMHKAAAARQMIATLHRALDRLREGNFGECAECGGEIEAKRLEAIPWARYCVKCQEARERA